MTKVAQFPRNGTADPGAPDTTVQEQVQGGDDRHAAPDRNPPLQPHEHDERPATEGGNVRPVIEQARADVDAGRVDTERRGVPSDVPAGRKSANSNAAGNASVNEAAGATGSAGSRTDTGEHRHE